MTKILVIGFGGFIGAVLRYIISGFVYRISQSTFPYGTLTVNVLGSFLLAFFLFMAEERVAVPPVWRSFFTIGMMGALTTFSTFSYETFSLFQEGLLQQALLNILLNVVVTLCAVWAGIYSARLL